MTVVAADQGFRDPKTTRRSAREDKYAKANRLLCSGSIWIESCVAGLVRAVVVGDHGTWLVTREPAGWRCSCPYPRRTCSHVEAVRRVTERPGMTTPTDPRGEGPRRATEGL